MTNHGKSDTEGYRNRVRKFLLHQLIGFAVVVFTLIVWAKAPDNPSYFYSVIMVSSGILSGLAVIKGLHSATNDPTLNRGDESDG